MKSGTIHVVFTGENTAVYGQHFFAASNTQYTVFSFVHAFFMDRLVTNTTHDTAKKLLFRQLASWLDHYEARQTNCRLSTTKPVQLI